MNIFTANSNWDSYVFVLSTILALGIYLWINKTFNYWKDRGIEYIPGSFPFGSVKKLAMYQTTLSEKFQSFYDESKGKKYIGFYFLFKPSLLVRDLDIIKDVLVKDFTTFVSRGMYSNAEIDPLSAHLFAIEGTYWKNLRAKLSPTFTSGKMKLMYKTVQDVASDLRNYTASKTVHDRTIEVKDLTARFGLDVISSIALGLEGNNFKNEETEMKKIVHMSVSPSTIQNLRITLALLCKDLAKLLKLRAVPKPVQDFFLHMVKENTEYREKFNVTRNDFMQMLIDLKNNRLDFGNNNGTDKGQLNITLNEMAAQSFVFVVAGFETTSVTLGFLLYELAMNPCIQDKLLEELDRVGTNLSYDELQQLPYLDMVLNETLRKHPPVPILQRENSKDYRLPDGKIIAAGTLLTISVLGLHRDPKLFPEPEKFNPERFSKENVQTIKPYSYLPFGEGPRICIGMRFAKMQIKLAVLAILSQFRIEKSSRTMDRIILEPKTFVYNAKGGMWLRLVERN